MQTGAHVGTAGKEGMDRKQAANSPKEPHRRRTQGRHCRGYKPLNCCEVHSNLRADGSTGPLASKGQHNVPRCMEQEQGAS